MPTDWDGTLARIGELLLQVDDPQLRETAVSFAAVASILPAPDEVGLGYWRNSLRLTWANREVEVFAHSIEIYRFSPAGTQIATHPFQFGDALPADVERLLVADAPPLNVG